MPYLAYDSWTIERTRSRFNCIFYSDNGTSDNEGGSYLSHSRQIISLLSLIGNLGGMIREKKKQRRKKEKKKKRRKVFTHPRSTSGISSAHALCIISLRVLGAGFQA